MFSAVVLRINGQFFQGIDPVLAYQVNAWISWLPIILYFEVIRISECLELKKSRHQFT